VRLHRFCPKTKYSTCAAPQKVVGLCKVVAPKLRFCTQHSSLTTILFQNHFPKAASQTCYQLLSKDVNCSNKKTKTAPHSYAGQRLPKSCAPELLRLPREVVSESGSKCFFLQLLPKAAVLHGKCPSVLPFPKARLQSNGRKAALLQTSSTQAIIRSGFRNLLPKLAMTTELPFRLGL
jgi:hypothetical protein